MATNSLPTVRQIRILEQDWKNCRRCSLGRKAFKHVLWDLQGNLALDVLFVGEGPGEAEDAVGRPFVGPAGRLLRPAVEQINIEFDLRVGYSNLISCRPTTESMKNRAPSLDEIHECSQRLGYLIHLTRPELVITLGRVPENEISWAMDHVPKPVPAVFGIEHPSFILREGGIGSGRYQRYVEKIHDLLQTAYKKKLGYR